MNQDILNIATARAKEWLNHNFSDSINQTIQQALENPDKDFLEAFYKDLEFGTGGMRGIMGVGPNRINEFTLGLATQALAEVVLEQSDSPSVAIAFDSRNNSKELSNKIADVLSANGVKVFIYENLRPTPQLSFTVRQFGCQAGIVVTASHNPPEYNGYKVYGSDGCQIVSPMDKDLVARVRNTEFSSIKFERNHDLVQYLGEAEDKLYFDAINTLSVNPEIVKQQAELPIVYTGLHGTGAVSTKNALNSWGFNNVIEVPEQGIPDGNFPTVDSPNPEEPAALKMAIDLAKISNAELVMGTDPDSDRVGIAVKDNSGEFVLLNGNQTASLIVHYILNQTELKGDEFIAKTVVTTDLLDRIAEHYNVDVVNTLTGFKYIGAAIRELEGKKRYIVGGEESYGYLIGDLVRDKDAISSCCMIAEVCAWAKQNGKTLLDVLEEIHTTYGFYQESLNSMVKKGIDGADEIKALVEGFRSNPMTEIAGEKVTNVLDFGQSTNTNLLSGEVSELDFDSSNFMQFITEKGSKITVRPSGTEPKIKFYISVNDTVSGNDYQTVQNKLTKQIEDIKATLGL
ncbi:MAG: phospho-sugar mutase [Flavobacteriales bacterium]